ncbi:vanillate O-demethylase oxidoreductase VanB [Burkholderia diffusa]|uniref:Vanillate O-demethylase oxidoreductase VanB n=1 Tax=Burkholderia diffusa TaxID=488732 RepID=A0AAW3P5N7_9BURK|nr:SRPBCC family protein [Burkholderia diffusa]KWF33718.1 vanillate O-demethylase oxidoreductase VanB [Burkholderia diffusa]KWF34038.1 vanillate O-demethylase oxidoreductase VanB [Burkholderia diffusa]KWF44127.1 vanillate O-demethylase oxidoreductase VanB [Burkholderia diffusa]KWF54095.1 vanillate O-demethylase oxidoreductase VanB [Burkholderia diffusa]
MTQSTDRIEKQALLAAPLARVWEAVSNAGEFGTWFGVTFDGPFVAGRPLFGRITPTRVDDDVAKAQEPYAGTVFEIVVDRIEPKQRFSFRWHPFAIDPNFDYASEPMTLVTFDLAEGNGGTLLTISETGFDQLIEARRAKAREMNDHGWAAQITLITKYLAKHA